MELEEDKNDALRYTKISLFSDNLPVYVCVFTRRSEDNYFPVKEGQQLAMMLFCVVPLMFEY